MIVFKPRVTKPADPLIFVPVGADGGSRAFDYDANFEYTVSSKDGSWATAVPDPEEKKVIFQVEANTTWDIRLCEIVVSPKNNPDFVVTTFQVIQASPEWSVYPRNIEVPAEGGDYNVWLTAPMEHELTTEISCDWISAGQVLADGIMRLKVHVDPLPEGVESRTGTIDVKSEPFYFNQITIVQKSSK